MLEVLVNGGLIGGLLYLLVLGSLFASLYQLYKKGRIDGKTFALLTGVLIAFIIQQQMVYESIVSYVMFFSVIAIAAGLSDTSGKSPQARIHGPAERTVIGIGIVLILLPVWLYGAYMPARKMEELQRIAVMPSDARFKLYSHVFHSSGSYAVNTDVEFYTDPLFYSYNAQKEQLKANPMYRKVASQEIDTLIKEVHPIWLKHQYSYHLSLSLLQLDNLEFYLTDDVQYLSQADVYAQRALALSPTDPQIYTIYAQTLMYKGDIVGARGMVNKALVLSKDYMPAVTLKEVLH
jgi:hypothetical protein